MVLVSLMFLGLQICPRYLPQPSLLLHISFQLLMPLTLHKLCTNKKKRKLNYWCCFWALLFFNTKIEFCKIMKSSNIRKAHLRLMSQILVRKLRKQNVDWKLYQKALTQIVVASVVRNCKNKIGDWRNYIRKLTWIHVAIFFVTIAKNEVLARGSIPKSSIDSCCKLC